MNFPVAILVGRSVTNSLVFSMYSPSIDAWLTYATCLWHQGVCFACLPSGRVTWQWNIPHVQGGNNKHLDDSWSKCSFYEYHSPNFGNFDWTLQQFGTCVTLNPRVQAGLVDQGSLYYQPKQCIVKKGNPSKLPWISIVWFPVSIPGSVWFDDVDGHSPQGLWLFITCMHLSGWHPWNFYQSRISMNPFLGD